MGTDLKNIKIIVSEIDGILTKGLYPTDELGNVLFKEYNFKDFEAINEIKKYFKFVFISKDNSINYNLCRRKQLPYYWSLSKEKTLVEDVLPRYGFALDNLIYIGSSFSDGKAMALAKLAVCPYDAPYSIKRIAGVILGTASGGGILSDFYESVILSNLSTL